MSKMKWMAVVAAGLALGLTVGCGSDDGNSTDSGGGATGTYAGTWTGNVCGRGLTMNVSQSGTSLSGTYTFTDPTFTDSFSGTVSSTTPPATARLNSGGHNWWFDLTFGSYNQMSGGFYKEGVLTCNVNATK